ncbi:MAG: hypothetical protein ACP5G5_06960 [Thermoplasmata archaeon]
MSRDEWYSKVRSATKDIIYLSNFYSNNGEYVLGKWVAWNPGSPPPFPYDHRTVLNNEVVFDIDIKDWDMVRRYAQIIINFLNSNGIGHLIGLSGGKGVHIHVFLKISDELYFFLKKLDTEDIDVAREIRLAFFDWVLSNIPQPPENAVDRSLVSWSSESKGHMVREFGGRKFVQVNGWEPHYKTYVTSIPRERVWVLSEAEVVYPEDIPYYRIKMGDPFAEVLVGRLKKVKRPVEIDIDREFPDMEYLRLPCIRKMLSEPVAEGKRNMTGKVLSAVCMKNLDYNKCRKLLESWHSKFYSGTDFKFREIESWLRTFEKKPKRELFFSCGENLRLIGENESFCRNKNCPVYVRRNELRGKGG